MIAGSGEVISLDERVAWEGILAGVPHAFGHTWESCHAMQQTTGYSTHLWHYRSRSAECVCPFAVRSFDGHEDIVTPYGFSGFAGTGEGQEMVAGWKQFAEERGYVCGYIGMNPLLAPEAFLRMPECRSIADLHFLDLDEGPEALLKAMDGNRQRQIRRWERAGRPLLHDRPALAAFFCDNFSTFMQSRQASATYRFSQDTLQLLANSSSSILLGAGSASSIDAAALFAHSPTIGEYLFLVTAPGSERYAVPLIWEGALALKERGVRWLNLGGGVTPHDGVAEFKRRFGGIRLQLPVLEHVYNRSTYDRLCNPLANGPSGSGAYFPPYHRRLKNVC